MMPGMAGLRYQQLVDWAYSRAGTIQWKVVHPALRGVANQYRNNLQNLINVVSVPAIAMRAGQIWQCASDIAILEVFGKLDDSGGTPEQMAEVERRIQVHSDRLNVNGTGFLRVGGEGQQVTTHPTHAAINIENICESESRFAAGIRAVMIGALTGAWTAFEVLAEELWIAALNAHPVGLSELKGKRPKKRAGDPEPTHSVPVGAQAVVEGSISISVPREIVQIHGYNFSQLMGTALKKSVSFRSLEGIREAYQSAFFEHYHSIDDALNSAAIRGLSAVRNILVHKGGKIDGEFFRQLQGARVASLSGVKEGDDLPVDGAVTAELVHDAAVEGGSLIEGVDSWIRTH